MKARSRLAESRNHRMLPTHLGGLNLSAAAGGQKQFASFVSSLPVGVWWLTACVVYTAKKKREKLLALDAPLYVVCCGVYIYMRRRRSVSDIRTVSFGKCDAENISRARAPQQRYVHSLIFVCLCCVFRLPFGNLSVDADFPREGRFKKRKNKKIPCIQLS